MKENTFLFSLLSLLLSRFYCESPRDSKTVKSRFRNTDFRSVCAVIAVDVFNKNKPSFYKH